LDASAERQTSLPLLIALTGAIGSGKSTLAAHAAAEAARGGRVEGFVQRAIEREHPGSGAQSYALELLGRHGGASFPYLMREEGRHPPYRALASAEGRLSDWLALVRADAAPIDLVVLDEIGLIEAGGGGHRERLQALLALEPAAVLIGVNRARLDVVEAALGLRFDVRIDAEAEDAAAHLAETLLARRDYERIGLYGAAAGAIEVGAGSIVHGVQLPLGGLGMATTQAVLLTRAAEGLNERGRVAWVALLSAGLKSLSPAGQRLGPMLAIAMQGLLYSRALALFGWNRFSVALGGALMGAWAGLQGIAVQWLLLGRALIDAIDVLAGGIAKATGLPAAAVGGLLAGWVVLHAGTVALGTALAWRQRQQPLRIEHERFRVPLATRAASSWRDAFRRGARELKRPLLWVPLLIVLAVLALAGRPAEHLVYVALRALAIGWLVFALVQRVDLTRLPARLRTLGRWGPALAWQRALRTLAGSDRQDPERPS
jgi:nucleoside-triphosphatase THEP1